MTIGDDEAKIQSKRHGGGGAISKLLTQRAGEPTFDVIIELRRGEFDEWRVNIPRLSSTSLPPSCPPLTPTPTPHTSPSVRRVVLDAGKAVDSVLDGQLYHAQRRTRNATTGAVEISYETA